MMSCSIDSLHKLLEVSGREVSTQLFPDQLGAGPALTSEQLVLADAVTSQAPPALTNCQIGVRRWVLLR